MKADITAAGLTSHRKGELVGVGGEMAKPVQSCGGSVRDDSLMQGPIPRRDLRGELQPRSAQFGMVRERRTTEVVHPVGNSPKDRTARDEAIEGRPGNPSHLSLAPRDEAPLVFGGAGNGPEGRGMRHYCIIPWIRGIVKYLWPIYSAIYPNNARYCSMPNHVSTPPPDPPHRV